MAGENRDYTIREMKSNKTLASSTMQHAISLTL